MSLPLVLIPTLALVLIVAGTLCSARKSSSPRGAELAWLVIPVAVLLGSIVFCGLGLYEGGPLGLLALCAASLVCAAVSVSRRRIDAGLEQIGSSRVRIALVAVPVLACVLLGFFALELPYNENPLGIAPSFALIQCTIIALALLALFFVFQRRGVGLVLGTALCWLIGVAQFFVASFKGTAILPNDLYALGTAAAVSGSYVYSVGDQVLYGLSCVVLAAAAAQLVPHPKKTPGRVRAVATNLVAAAGSALLLAAFVSVPSYANQLGVGMDYWFTLDFYKKQGMLTTFVTIAQDMAIKVPSGYTDDAAHKLEDAYVATYDETLTTEPERSAAQAQFQEVQPTVIAIMNETFADLSSFRGNVWGYNGPTSLDEMSGLLAHGDMSVSVLGGGTCNSEFEFLTGVSLAYVGDGKYPYQIYDLTDTPSLARQFSEMGYVTTAIHPNLASNWSRDEVYQKMGFDQFLSIDDFTGAPTFHSGVTDAATYEKILELLEKDDSPQFIFDVTMQNHSGYDQGNIPEDQLGDYAVEGFGDYDNGQINEYLACIKTSERDLAEFVATLERLDRPVVLVFFGDHQPYVSTALNGTLFPDEDPTSVEHNLRTHETAYLVWANYDVAGAGDEPYDGPASLAYLASATLETIGAPLTDFQKAQLVAREEMPALTLVGACHPDGTWTALDEQETLPKTYDDLARITYLEFARHVE